MENPSVFAMLCGKEETDHKEKAYMCMNGQPRLAGLMALDLLAKSETRIYYAGDLDPEGVLIAQKLSQYYKGEFLLLAYGSRGLRKMQVQRGHIT